MAPLFVAIVGATGNLGQLVAKNLTRRGVLSLQDRNVSIAPVNFSDVAALTRELHGATCVVSTLQGLRDVIHNVQGNLLDAAVAAKVPRFIPSDFSLDFTKTKPGSNRNLDLRREFHARIDRSGIAWTSILNGGFMDLLGGDSPVINHKKGKVVYVGKATQLLDLTTIPDTAAYTAAVGGSGSGDVVSVVCREVGTSSGMKMKSILVGFHSILWEHLDAEVRELGAEHVQKYWSRDEVLKMPM